MKVEIMWCHLIFSVILLCSNVKGDDYGTGGTPATGPNGPTPIPSPAKPSPSPPPPPSPPSPPPPPPPSPPSPPPSPPSPPASPPSSPPSPPSSSSTNASSTGTNDISGLWYIVMGDSCGDQSLWNMVCNCFTVNFRPLQSDNWQMFTSSINNLENNTLGVSMGGIQSMSSDSNATFKGFILSSTEVPESVLCTKTSYTISQTVRSSSAYLDFQMTVIGYDEEEALYMITSVTCEQSEYTLVWSRNRAPGKQTLWTKIVQNLYALNLNPHNLNFIDQLECKVPTLNQYDEMFFCS